jgi:hypothetical protein
MPCAFGVYGRFSAGQSARCDGPERDDPVIHRRPSRWLPDIAAAGQRACWTPRQPSTKPTQCYRLCPQCYLDHRSLWR